VLTPQMEARILEKTRRRRPTAVRTGVRASSGACCTSITTSWAKRGGAPHRFERYMQSDDPDFETKAADAIGLYVNPPDHAAVFAVDEKAAIQALDRLDPVLPLSPGRAERHGFEHFRHGTLSLLAALNTKSGEVRGQTVPRHTSAAFVDFLGAIVTSQPKGREIHMNADNLSTHNAGGSHVPVGAPDRTPLLHPDLILVAQPGGALVCQDRTRPARARCRHIGRGPWAEDSPLHPPLQQDGETSPLELSQPGASN
jgi:DDE superfamily endonuclease